MNKAGHKLKHPGYKRWVLFFVLLGIGVHAGVFYLFTLDLQDPESSDPQDAFVY